MELFKFYNNIPIERGMGSSSVDLITIFKIIKKLKVLKFQKIIFIKCAAK